MDIYALTESHNSVVSAIFSDVGIRKPVSLGESDDFWVRALWDTGATNSAISDKMAKKLKLPYTDFVAIYTAVGIIQAPIYSVRLLFQNDLLFEQVEVVQFTGTDTEDCDLIIGMDIMTLGDVAITNLNGKTVFSFRVPSLHLVDFEKENS
jgi:predicted aspartyl protease